MVMAIISAFLSGITIVLSRTFNAKLTSYTNLTYSTLFNYILGLIGSVIIFIITKTTLPTKLPPISFSSLILFTGGMLGILTVAANSYLTSRISALVFTLLLFCAQLFAGIALDYFVYDEFSFGKVIGGIIILVGLWLSNQDTKK